MKKFLFLCFALGGCSLSLEDGRSVYYVDNEGAQMPVITIGPDTRRIILFVHGGPGGTSVGTSQFPSMKELAKSFRLVFYDQRGSGGAKGQISKSSITIPQFVRDLDAVVESIKYKRPDAEIILLGHSFGGLVSGAYASVHSAKLKGLAWISPALNIQLLQASLSTNMTAQIDRVLQKNPLNDNVRSQLTKSRKWYADHSTIDLKGFIEHFKMMGPYYEEEGLKSSWGSLTLLGQDPIISLAALPGGIFSVLGTLNDNGESGRNLENDPAYRLANISVPVALFTGWKDIIIPVDTSLHSFNTLNPALSKKHYAYTSGDVGHNSHAEYPERFAADLKEFIALIP